MSAFRRTRHRRPETVVVVVETLSINVDLVWLPEHPIGSIIVIIIDMFILYVVLVHGRELKA